MTSADAIRTGRMWDDSGFTQSPNGCRAARSGTRPTPMGPANRFARLASSDTSGAWTAPAPAVPSLRSKEELDMRQPTGTHLAQINVGRAVNHIDSDAMRDFKVGLYHVNALADRSPGFVWRLQDESGDATGILTSADPNFLINLSVWETPEALQKFVWMTVHRKFYLRKASWFEPMTTAHFAMWWVEIGHEPTPQEGLERLEQLRRDGPTEAAFGWESLEDAEIWRAKRCA